MRLEKQRQLFKNKQFTYLLGEQVLTQFSYSLVSFSSVITVFKLTKSNFSVGILLLCFYLPSIFTAMLAGMVSDHFHRKKILTVTNIIWASLVVVMAFTRNNYWLFLLITILIQITDEFFQNANAATIPMVVEEKNLISANTIFSLTNYLCLIVGSISVGLLIRFFSP
ncbi:MAG TPA: MFS transporter, partial [Candidatus Woesebacteria bacterium]|nr:MFS transporter [Candidatus Woesebacteria bacterium]